MAELLLEAVQTAALIYVGWRAVVNAAASEQAIAAADKINNRYDQMKRLYEKAQRRLSEHITAPIHRR